MDLLNLVRLKQKGNRIADLHAVHRTTPIVIDNQLYPEALVIDVETTTLVSNESVHTLKLLIQYEKEGNEHYAQFTRLCIAPAGCSPDWTNALCAWEIAPQQAPA